MATAIESPPDARQPVKTAFSPRPLGRLTAAWGVLVVGVLSWFGSLLLIRSGPDGSPPLPMLAILWYVAVAATAAVCLYGVVRRGPPPAALLTAGLVTLVLILYGTTSFVHDPTRMAWAAKHIGVTRSVLERGSFAPSADSYHRWPGSVLLGSLLDELGDFSDPTGYAGWTQVFFALLLALVVFTLARTLSTNSSAAWGSVLVFSGAYWIAQLYATSQALALSMHLGLLLLVFSFFRRRPNRLGRKIERLLGGRTLGKDFPPVHSTSPAVKMFAFGCILLTHAASTLADQWTTFLTLLAVGVLLLLGYLRSWPLVGALVLITVGNLVFDLPGNTSLLDDLGPVADLRPQSGTSPLQQSSEVEWGAIVLILVVALLAMLAVRVRSRRGTRPALLCAAMIVSPILLMLVPGVGTQARLQALMFALPWCAVPIGWLVGQVALEGVTSSSWRWRVLAPRPRVAPTSMAAQVHPRERTTRSSKGWEGGAPLVLSLTLVAAVLTATLSLRWVPKGYLSDYGLPPALPLAWYVALAVLALSALASVAFARPRPWLAALHLLGLVYVLYGSGVILADAPRFPWTYKHIGVTRYITEFGHVTASIDIYHRWPGFFSLASLFGAVAGLPDPLAYAAWTGASFVALQALLVVAIARTLLGSTRSAWTAGFVFVCINWVGQDYFAPQPFAFALALGVVWLTLVHFRSTPSGRLGDVGTRLVSSIARTGQIESKVAPEPLWGRRTAFAFILLVYIAIVPSHQLTPYLIVLMVGGLSVTKSIQTRWLPVVLLAIALSFLIPNFTFVRQHFNIFSGLDPFGNAEPVNTLDRAQPGKTFAVRAGLALSVTFLVGALVGLVLAWRRGTVGVFHAAVAAGAPALLLLVQSYGGEGGLRVILFASPWAAVLIASAVETRAPKSSLALAPVLAVLLALFLPSYYGAEEINRIPRGEVIAADFLYANGAPRSIVLPSAPGFPLRSGARYPLFRHVNSLSTRALDARSQLLGEADVNGVIDAIHRYGEHGYVIFSDSQETYATVFGKTTPENLRVLEKAMVASQKFQVFYENDTTRIYELVN